MRLGRPGDLRVERHQDVVHDCPRLREAAFDAELHVDAVLFEIPGQCLEPREVIAIVVHGLETRRRDDVTHVHVEAGIGKEGDAPGSEPAECDFVFEYETKDIGVQ